MAPRVLFLLACYFLQINGHGILMEPPNRSSIWRFNNTAPPNYGDNQLFCGGYYVQYELNGGKCGVCGDDYSDPIPRANENTGLYGQGWVVREYQSGSIIDVHVWIVANHLGNFQFSLCELKNPNAPESGEECFQPLLLANGLEKHPVTADQKQVYLQLQLPRGLKCERCVLRWIYTSGNNWGFCDDGTSGMGCGPQETFRGCADVAIV